MEAPMTESSEIPAAPEAESSDSNNGVSKRPNETQFLRPLFSHYKEVRVQMQLISIGISVLVSMTEIAMKGQFTPAAISVLSGIPLCAWLARMIHKQETITYSFLEGFDLCVISAALAFDVCAVYALSQSNSGMFATCVAYLTVAYVLPQVSQRYMARIFTIAHMGLVLFLFEFDIERCVPFIINCVLLDVGNDKLARSLGMVAQRQLVANTELFMTSQRFMKSMLSGFCDALVVMGPQWTLAEESQSLSTLLGRPALQGKKFDSFIDPGDIEEFTKYMESSIGAMAGTGVELPQIDNYRTVRLHSVKIHLYDAYNKPIAVHLCSASLQTLEGELVHLVGISEMWVPLAKAKKTRRPILSHNTTTGKLESPQLPSRPEDLEINFSTNSLDVLSKDPDGLALPGIQKCTLSRAQKRKDSPAPSSGDSLSSCAARISMPVNSRRQLLGTQGPTSRTLPCLLRSPRPRASLASCS